MGVIVLILMLAAFPAQAATICVEDNVSKCAELGYTKSSCEYGGVSCPYDSSKYYCEEWRCEDGRYSSENVDNACVAVKYKNLDCFECEGCLDDQVDYDTCWSGIMGSLLRDFSTCEKLGYVDDAASCSYYLECPATAEKIRCIDEM